MKKIYVLIISVTLSLVLFISSFMLPQYCLDAITNKQPTYPVIIIDAGHGGFDGGASTDDGHNEKDINLRIALLLNEYLTLSGFETVMTRDKDVSLEDTGLNTIRQKKTSDIHNRHKIMSDINNCIFVSIHQNHFSHSKYSGLQVFYSRNFSSESSLLAQSIQDRAVSLLQPDNTRTIKECGTSVYLIYNAVAPAVLVECGFLSNPEEASKLLSYTYCKEIAMAIALGIVKYTNS